MDTIKTIEEIYDIQKSIVTIGNFDGMHKGHKTIIDKVVQYKKDKGFKSVVFTFSNHPVNYFKPHNIKNILTNEDKLKILSDIGIDITISITFDEYMTTVDAKEFVRKILVDKLNVQKLIIGHDFCFGKNKEGNVELLKRLSKIYNFELEVIEPIKINHTRISSTKIRNLIEDGNIEEANLYLGHRYFLRGEIIKCRQLGRTIGFPTANIDFDKEVITPKVGIYATKVYIDDEVYIGATNVGYNPTVNGKKLSIETHIIDFNEEIYGKEIKVEFLERIRDEKKFSGLDELKNQLEKDTNYIIENYVYKV